MENVLNKKWPPGQEKTLTLMLKLNVINGAREAIGEERLRWLFEAGKAAGVDHLFVCVNWERTPELRVDLRSDQSRAEALAEARGSKMVCGCGFNVSGTKLRLCRWHRERKR